MDLHLRFEVTVMLPGGDAKTGVVRRPLENQEPNNVLVRVESALAGLKLNPVVLQVIPFMVKHPVKVQLKGFEYIKPGYVGGGVLLTSIKGASRQ